MYESFRRDGDSVVVTDTEGKSEPRLLRNNMEEILHRENKIELLDNILRHKEEQLELVKASDKKNIMWDFFLFANYALGASVSLFAEQLACNNLDGNVEFLAMGALTLVSAPCILGAMVSIPTTIMDLITFVKNTRSIPRYLDIAQMRQNYEMVKLEDLYSCQDNSRVDDIPTIDTSLYWEDDSWRIGKELDAYFYNHRVIKRCQKDGELEEFLYRNYNITDEESLCVYRSLMEQDTHQGEKGKQLVKCRDKY